MSFLDIFAIIVSLVAIASAVLIFVILGMTPGHVAYRRAHHWGRTVRSPGGQR